MPKWLKPSILCMGETWPGLCELQPGGSAAGEPSAPSVMAFNNYKQTGYGYWRLSGSWPGRYSLARLWKRGVWLAEGVATASGCGLLAALRAGGWLATLFYGYASSPPSVAVLIQPDTPVHRHVWEMLSSIDPGYLTNLLYYYSWEMQAIIVFQWLLAYGWPVSAIDIH